MDQVLLLLHDVACVFVVDGEHAERLEFSVQVIQLSSVEWSRLCKFVNILAIMEEFVVFAIDYVHVALFLALRLEALKIQVREEAGLEAILKSLCVNPLKRFQFLLDAGLQCLKLRLPCLVLELHPW